MSSARCVLLYPGISTLPSRATGGSVGYDLYSTTDQLIGPGERALIGTGIALEIPAGHYGRIAPRSGLSIKHSIDVAGGVIDQDYRGEIKVILVNNGKATFEVAKNTRIAQLIFEKCSILELQIVDSLVESRRGTGGFGSTH